MDILERILRDENYVSYTAFYASNVKSKYEVTEEFIITPIQDEYAIVSVHKNIGYNILKQKTKKYFTFIEKLHLYTLDSIDPIDAAGMTEIQNLELLNLTGRGVMVGVIDTGINYLNKEFQNLDGTTRINFIWDQNIIGGKQEIEDTKVNFGSIYSKDDINSAIESWRAEGNPYEIVPSKDEFGHGTKMSGIIGARGVNPEVKGGAYECEFLVVKLIEDITLKKELGVTIPIFNLTSVFSAVTFLAKYALKVNKPLVIYLPLSTNFTNHKGNNILENYIDYISINRGIVVVTGSGNEGNRDSHTSGVLGNIEEIKDIGLYIDPLQKNLAVHIWVNCPNIMAINIISPSGEETGVVPSFLESTEVLRFIFEDTSVLIQYYLPEESSGDELIEIYFTNVTSGTWKIRVIGIYILDGRFDAWIPQKGITLGDTKFTYADPYGTMTSPGASRYIITVAAYDQTKNYISNISGRSFEDDIIDRLDIAAGGINVMTTDISGEGISVVSGTSVAAAVVVGACALLMQWGIVDKNDLDMYSLKIKAFLIRGVKKREGDIYPNPEVGYGILNIIGVFRYMT